MIYEQLVDKDNLSYTEALIAAYIMQCDSLLHVSARQIATSVGTAPSTVTRFTKKLGFESYQAFVETYEEERIQRIKMSDIDPNYPFTQNDKNNIIAEKIGNLYKDIVDDVIRYMTHDRMSRVLSIMRKAKRFIIVSAGIQQEIAKSFVEKMMSIDKDVVVVDHVYQAYTLASHKTSGSVFILLSYSGETEMIVRIAQYLKEHDIPMILITRYGHHTLTKYSENILYVSSKENLYKNLGQYAMNLSTLLILDILYTAMFNEDYFSNQSLKVQTEGFDHHRQKGE